MDITPIYELKTRLCAAAIAGTNLLSEDFRLKKAAASFAPLAKSSPVFAKINEMTGKLLTEPSPENLLDTITLVDAVITTLGTTDVPGELEPIEIAGNSTAIINAPYSQLSAVIDALTTSGSGNYNTVLTARNETPELFNDYRVIPALVKGLGASYAELADTAANILKGMGNEIIPIVKKDFDPKGKKDMIRRLNIIEDVCGAEENDFYLEQLENAEKDVRKALIYALRHDERNTDKLIELTKTEKGKPRTAALAALISFDNEQAEEFFNEYAKKKPAEVISVLEKSSSEWTSKLAARLINEALVDDKGNKITLSQAAEVNKVKLKIKTSFWDMNSALWGKWGAEIEKIYREFRCEKNTPIAVGMDMRLEETILATNDKGLKALAAELNNAPETKGIYVGAEAAARFLSKEDNSDWLIKQITADYEERQKSKQSLANNGIIRILRKIFFGNGKYYLTNRCYDPISDEWLTNSPREISSEQIRGAVSDTLMKCPCWEYDRLLSDWIDESDKEYCKKIGEHFCENLRHFNGTGFSDANSWCSNIKKCGFYNVKDLALDYFKNAYVLRKSYTTWIMAVVQNIPGDDAYRVEEARAIVKLAREKKPPFEFDIDKFEDWANTRYNHN
ncbi:MAG: hypothetical protein K2J80_05695 [Oscillospiraceae bacterium]|nr:hypothetical protein [Oscillospiraceae bacterium]